MIQYLATITETVPEWLANYVPGKKIDIQEVLKSRVLYYPGSGDDGQPVKTFGQTHSIHTFLYVDYLLTRENLLNNLAKRGFTGYHPLGRLEISESDLVPNGWNQHVHLPAENQRMMTMFVANDVKPYCFMEIFERNADRDETHGSSRFAIIFLCGDGIASYDAIFCNEKSNVPAPFVLVLQDHGFGCNYDRFGAGGLMEEVALRTGVYPKYMLVAEHTKPWKGYKQIPNQMPVPGGMHQIPRSLYQRNR